MKKYHRTIGHITLLLSFQRTDNGIDQSKFVGLAKSWNYVDHKGHSSLRTTRGRIHPHYYLVWGPNEDLSEGGFTLLLTKTGRAVSYSSAMKSFRDAVNSTEFISFSNC